MYINKGWDKIERGGPRPGRRSQGERSLTVSVEERTEIQMKELAWSFQHLKADIVF